MQISADLQKVLEKLAQAAVDAQKIDAAGVQIVIIDRFNAGVVYSYFGDEVCSLPAPTVLN